MDLAQLIKQKIEQEGWSQNEFARRAELANSMISDILAGKKGRPYKETLAKIASVLELPFARVAEAAGYEVVNYDTPEEDVELLKALAMMPEFRQFAHLYQSLSYRDRMVVLAMVKSLQEMQAHDASGTSPQ